MQLFVALLPNASKDGDEYFVLIMPSTMVRTTNGTQQACGRSHPVVPANAVAILAGEDGMYRQS
jgi:hypothetical protein